MGDRAQLKVTDGKHSVFLYTHWAGSELPDILAKGIVQGAGDGRTLRDDPSYAMGCIVRRLVAETGGVDATTGFGMGFSFDDNDDERGAPLVLNVAHQTVSFKSHTVSVDEFINHPEGHAITIDWH